MRQFIGMNHMRNVPALIALFAATALGFNAKSSDKPVSPITIAGDFVPDRCSVDRPLAKDVLEQEIRKPVTIPWHAGMTISGALREAGLRPLSDNALTAVHSGDNGVRVTFESIRRDKRVDIALAPGAHISYWALAF